MFGAIGTAVGSYFGGPIGGAVGGAIGGMLDSSGQRSSVMDQASAQEAAAREAAAAGRFRPIGVTTNFGSSNFKIDPKTGQVTEAGYTLNPQMQAQQGSLLGISDRALGQYQGAFNATAPLGTAAQGLMGLGQGYLATTPQEQAAKYMQEQQALLAPSRAQQLSQLQNQQFQQGRTGLAIGGGEGTMATNPEMAAYYNALAQQDAQLAAQSTQGGMEYAKFGAGLLGTGGTMLGSMYGLQSQAYDPYKTAMGGAQMIEGLGQNAFDLGMSIGTQGKATPTSQQLLSEGLNSAANLRAQAGDQWSGLLSGAGDAIKPYIPEITQKVGDWWRGTPEYGYSTSWGE